MKLVGEPLFNALVKSEYILRKLSDVQSNRSESKTMSLNFQKIIVIEYIFGSWESIWHSTLVSSISKNNIKADRGFTKN